MTKKHIAIGLLGLFTLASGAHTALAAEKHSENGRSDDGKKVVRESSERSDKDSSKKDRDHRESREHSRDHSDRDGHDRDDR